MKVAVFVILGLTALASLMYFIVVRETDDAPAEAGILAESIRREYVARVATPTLLDFTPFSQRGVLGPPNLFLPATIERATEKVGVDGGELTYWIFRAWFESWEEARDFCGRVRVEDVTVPEEGKWDLFRALHKTPCRNFPMLVYVQIFHATIANFSQHDYDAWAWCRTRSEDGLIESESALFLSIPATGVGMTVEALQIKAQHRVEVHVSVSLNPCANNSAMIEFEFQVRR